MPNVGQNVLNVILCLGNNSTNIFLEFQEL